MYRLPLSELSLCLAGGSHGGNDGARHEAGAGSSAAGWAERYLVGHNAQITHMARPEQVDVWIGLDVGKENHFAEVLDDAGERIFARGVANDEAALEALLTGPASAAPAAW